MPKIYKRYEVPPSKGLSCGPGLTQQHFKDECDINYIIRHYNGQTPPEPVYGDVSMFEGLQSAIDLVDSANDNFMALPSKIRDDFGHDPVAFYQFANNPQNYQYLVDNGLAFAKEAKKRCRKMMFRHQMGTVLLDVTVPTDTKITFF